ncbi:hypothetical protein RB195_000585 [Necator americanus]|uniref:Uncharacterized protein n=1 Tax=Necator americanus TaxID=51031 RepID=A0ABR1DAL1_NECAM
MCCVECFDCSDVFCRLWKLTKEWTLASMSIFKCSNLCFTKLDENKEKPAEINNNVISIVSLLINVWMSPHEN